MLCVKLANETQTHVWLSLAVNWANELLLSRSGKLVLVWILVQNSVQNLVYILDTFWIDFGSILGRYPMKLGRNLPKREIPSYVLCHGAQNPLWRTCMPPWHGMLRQESTVKVFDNKSRSMMSNHVSPTLLVPT